MKVGENFIQHTRLRSERGEETSASRVFSILLHVKIAVIPSLSPISVGLFFAFYDWGEEIELHPLPKNNVSVELEQ